MKLKNKIAAALTALATALGAGATYQVVQNSNEVSVVQNTDEKLATKLDSTNSAIPVATATPEKAVAQNCTLNTRLYRQANTYTIHVENIGGRVCKKVSFSIYYPAGERYLSAAPRPTASDYYWELGDLKKGSLETVVLGVQNPGEDTHLCATANNGADSCAFVHIVPSTEENQGTTTGPAPITSKENGIWVWTPPNEMTESEMEAIIADAKRFNFNAIYLTVDAVLTSDREAFTRALASFVTKANAQGIAVDAEAGWRDQAKPENRHKIKDIVAYLIEYNKTNPKVRAFQSDVEPYLLPEYERNKAPVLTHFVEFIDEVEQQLRGSGIGFSVVIPHFYDSKNRWTPKIAYMGRSTYAYDHILTILDRTEGNTIVIMAYRDTVYGSDGVDGIVRQEISQAGKTKVIVAQETGNVEPDYVTFFGQRRAEFVAQLDLIEQAYRSLAGYGGIATHYYEPFMELE